MIESTEEIYDEMYKRLMNNCEFRENAAICVLVPNDSEAFKKADKRIIALIIEEKEFLKITFAKEMVNKLLAKKLQ